MSAPSRTQAEQALAAFIHCEEWRPIPGYERTYEVSDLGRVRSHPRPTTPGGIRRTPLDSFGYPRVSMVQDGIQRSFRVHVLVMLAFVGPRPAGHEVRHINGDRRDPRLVNLAYGTHAENMRDMVTHGTSSGVRTHCRRGHEFTPENTRIEGTLKKRRCRTCLKARESRR